MNRSNLHNILQSDYQPSNQSGYDPNQGYYNNQALRTSPQRGGYVQQNPQYQQYQQGSAQAMDSNFKKSIFGGDAGHSASLKGSRVGSGINTPNYQQRRVDTQPIDQQKVIHLQNVLQNSNLPAYQNNRISQSHTPAEYHQGYEPRGNIHHNMYSGGYDQQYGNVNQQSPVRQNQNVARPLSPKPATPVVIQQQSNPQDLPRLSTVVKVDPYTKSDPTVKRPYFAEKRVIVTGASSGIGRAVAMWFLNSGARVALIGTDLEDLINTGKQFPKQALVIKCDLSADDQPYDMFNTVMHEFNGIDILVNAAGIFREGDIKTMKPQEYDRIIDVNLRSVFYLSYLFFPALQKSRGCIVNVSCQYGAKPFAGMYAYCMSKAGLETLTKNMAYEFASSGVRVNAVAPGLVETNLLRCRVGEPKLSESDIEQIYSNAEKFNPLKRIASIDDVGKAIVFLCSDGASHVTGQILKVDGGRTLTSSGWFLWEGHKGASSIIEPKESVISTFKGKILAPSNIMLGYTEKDRIEALSKRTNWATTDKEAHANIKGAIYHEQDARHEYNAQIVGRATEEEIKRLTLEEDLPDVKRAVHILFRGQAVQKPSVFVNLHKILLDADNESFAKVFPLVSDEIFTVSEETQTEAARSLNKLIMNHEVEKSRLLDFYNMTIKVLSLWNQPVLDAWLLVFHELLKRIPYEMIANSCEMSIDKLSEQSQHPQSKYAASRMIGFLAERGIKPTKPLFDQARFLCNDAEVEIRRVLAEEVLVKICRNLGTGLTESKYIEKIFEFVYDSDSGVKMAAIDSLVELLDVLSPAFKRSKMISVFFDLMNSSNEEMMKKMSFLVGKIFYKLESIMLENKSNVTQVETCIKEWIAQKNPEVRRNIVYNLPYLIRVFEDKTLLKDLYFKATRDTIVDVRVTAISSFHEIVKSFELKEAKELFRDTFEVILREEEVVILEKVLPQLPDLIAIFQPSTEEEVNHQTEEDKERDENMRTKGKEYAKWRENKDWRDTEGDRSGQSTKPSSKESLDQKSYLEDIINMGNTINKNHAWRLEITFMETMDKCFNCFTLKDFGEAYPNFLLKEIEKGNNNVRRCAIQSLIQFMLKNYYMNKTDEIVKRIVSQFSEAKNYQARIAFLQVYEQFSQHFSRQFFKNYNLNEVAIALASDKVFEVRKKFVENALNIRKMTESDDKPFLAKLEGALLKNVTDKNKMISEGAKQALKDLKLLTKLFFEGCNAEDIQRQKNEEKLREKEKEENEALKKKQHEEILRGRNEQLNLALNSLLIPGRKPMKKYFWNNDGGYSVKIQKSCQSATLVPSGETPKLKNNVSPVLLPSLKPTKTTTTTSNNTLQPPVVPSGISKEPVESKPRNFKVRMPKQMTVVPGNVLAKKKAGSVCVDPKDKYHLQSETNTSIHKDLVLERNHSKGRNVLTEPVQRHSVDVRINKMNHPSKGLIDRALNREKAKTQIQIPSIKKNY